MSDLQAPTPSSSTNNSSQSIETLIERMPGRRATLLAVLDHCAQQRSAADVEAFIDQKQSINHSVYSAASLCALLHEAGALERVTADAAVFDPAAHPTTQTVVVDGVEYVEPSPVPELFWRTTPAGRDARAQHDPAAKLQQLLTSNDELPYTTIYERVLTLCAQDGGASTAELSKAVDHDPLVQSPRYFVQRFVERLESCGALVWDGSWTATEVGTQALGTLL